MNAKIEIPLTEYNELKKKIADYELSLFKSEETIHQLRQEIEELKMKIPQTETKSFISKSLGFIFKK